MKDDFTTYYRDNSCVADDGPVKCNPSDPQTQPLPWEWQHNETALAYPPNASGSFSGIKYGLLELTATTLRLRDSHNAVVHHEFTYTAF